MREILNAIFYVVRSGCAWRLLPHEFPPWPTAYHYFRLWRLDGTWEHLHQVLRERLRTRSPVLAKTSLVGYMQAVPRARLPLDYERLCSTSEAAHLCRDGTPHGAEVGQKFSDSF